MGKQIKIILVFALMISINFSVFAQDKNDKSDDSNDVVEVIEEENEEISEKKDVLSSKESELVELEEEEEDHEDINASKEESIEQKNESDELEETIEEKDEVEEVHQESKEVSKDEQGSSTQVDNVASVSNWEDYASAYNDNTIEEIHLEDDITADGSVVLKRRISSLIVKGNGKSIKNQGFNFTLFLLDIESSEKPRTISLDGVRVLHNSQPIIDTSDQIGESNPVNPSEEAKWTVSFNNFYSEDETPQYIVSGIGIDVVTVKGYFVGKSNEGVFKNASDLLIEDANVEANNGIIGSNIRILGSILNSTSEYGIFLSNNDIYVDDSTLNLDSGYAEAFMSNHSQSTLTLTLKNTTLELEKAKVLTKDFSQVNIIEDSNISLNTHDIGIKADDLKIDGSVLKVSANNQGLDVGDLRLEQGSKLEVEVSGRDQYKSGIKVHDNFVTKDSIINVNSKSRGIQIDSINPTVFKNSEIVVESTLTGFELKGKSDWANSFLDIKSSSLAFKSNSEERSSFKGTEIKVISDSERGFHTEGPFSWEGSSMTIDSAKQGLYSNTEEPLNFDNSPVEIVSTIDVDSQYPAVELNGPSNWENSNLSITSKGGVGLKSHTESLLKFKEGVFKVDSYLTGVDVAGPVEWIEADIDIDTRGKGVFVRKGSDLMVKGNTIKHSDNRIAWETTGDISMENVEVEMENIDTSIKASKIKVSDSIFNIVGSKYLFSTADFLMEDSEVKTDSKLAIFLTDAVELSGETEEVEVCHEIVDSKLKLKTSSSESLFKLGKKHSYGLKQLVIRGPETKIDILSEGSRKDASGIFELKGQAIDESKNSGIYIKEGAKVNVMSLYDPQIVYLEQPGSKVQIDGKDTEFNVSRKSQISELSLLFYFFYVGNQTFQVSDEANVNIHAEKSRSPAIRMSGDANKIIVESGAKLKVNTEGAASGQTSDYNNNSQAIVFTEGYAGNKYKAKNSFEITGEGTHVKMVSKKGGAIYSPYSQLDLTVGEDASFIADGKTDGNIALFQGYKLHFVLEKPEYYDFINRVENGGLVFKSFHDKTSYQSLETDLFVWEKGEDVEGDASKMWAPLDFKLEGKSLTELVETNSQDFKETFASNGMAAYTRVSGQNAKSRFVLNAKETFMTLKDFSKNVKTDKDLMERMEVEAYEEGAETIEHEALVLKRDDLEYENPQAGSYTITFVIDGHDTMTKEEKIHILPYDHLGQTDEYLIVANDFYDGNEAYLEENAYFIEKANAKAWSKEDLSQELIVSLKENTLSGDVGDYPMEFYLPDEGIDVEITATILDRKHVVETKDFVIAANDFKIMEYEAVDISHKEIIDYSQAYGIEKSSREKVAVEVLKHNVIAEVGEYSATLIIK